MKKQLLNVIKTRFVFVAAIGLSLILTACTKGIDISDQELKKRMGECVMEQNKTPGMAVACGNYAKECRRRGEKTGNFIC